MSTRSSPQLRWRTLTLVPASSLKPRGSAQPRRGARLRCEAADDLRRCHRGARRAGRARRRSGGRRPQRRAQTQARGTAHTITPQFHSARVIRPLQFSPLFQEVCAQAGCPDFVSNSMRHTAGSDLSSRVIVTSAHQRLKLERNLCAVALPSSPASRNTLVKNIYESARPGFVPGTMSLPSGHAARASTTPPSKTSFADEYSERCAAPLTAET